MNQPTPTTHKRAALTALLTLIIGVGAMLAPASAEASSLSRSTCWGEGCTHLSVSRQGDALTIQAHGFSYVPGRRVVVQINITDAVTGALIFRDSWTYTANSGGRTSVKTVFIDCGHQVLVQAWTWKSGSGTQPEVQIYA
jgi:hypothetical protein